MKSDSFLPNVPSRGNDVGRSPLTTGLALRPGSGTFHAVDNGAFSPFAVGYETSKSVPQLIDLSLFKDWAALKQVEAIPVKAVKEAQAVRRGTIYEEPDLVIPLDLLNIQEPSPTPSSRRTAEEGEEEHEPTPVASSGGETPPASPLHAPVAKDQISVYDGVAFNPDVKQNLINWFRQLVRSTGEMNMEDEHGEMSELMHVFISGGFPYSVNVNWIHEAAEEVLSGRTALDNDDFESMLSGYERRLTECMEKIYKDIQKIEPVRVSHLPAMLLELGMVAIPSGIRETLAFVRSKKNVGQIALDREITVDDFVMTYLELHSRAGLSPSEHSKLKKGFEAKARETDGETEEKQTAEGERPKKQPLKGERVVDPEKLMDIFNWNPIMLRILGGSTWVGGEERVMQLTREALDQTDKRYLSLDPAKFGPMPEPKEGRAPVMPDLITEYTYMFAARMVHEDVSNRLLEKLEVMGVDKDSVRPKDVSKLFYHLGAVSVRMSLIITECMEALGLQGKETLVYEEVYAILMKYVDKHGFTTEDQEAIVDLFVTLTERLPDTGESKKNALHGAEISRALRWHAYIPTQYRLFDYIEANNELSEQSHCSQDEFLKVYTSYLILNVGPVWNEFYEDEDNDGWIPLKDLKRLLDSAGQLIEDNQLNRLFKISMNHPGGTQNGKIDWKEFLRLEAEYRMLLKDRLKLNNGFTDREVQDMQADFNKKDVAEVGIIAFDQAMKIMREKFPGYETDAMFRDLAAKAQFETTGKITLTEFLWCMRRVTDKVNTSLLQKAKDIRTKCRFSKDEVRGLRDLFNVCDADRSGDVDVDELKQILSGLVSMVGETVAELRKFIADVDMNNDGVLDFWEFLQLMRTLQDLNWRNINGVAGGRS